MRTAVVGAGPVGLVCARALAERGDDVLLLDRDAGPAADGSWRRKGVMQFLHPHFFRHHVRRVLEQRAPAMWEAVVRAGCVVNDPPPGLPPHATSLSARRSTFEAALRSAVVHERVTQVAAHADRLLVDGDRVVGIVAAGATYDVDRVVVANGRTSRFADDLRPPAEGGPCGQSYVSRMYRALPGVEPLTAWAPLGALYDGYQSVVFPQDEGTLSALFVWPTGDDDWALLRDEACFDRAASQVPALAPWTDPERFAPITGVLRGGTLTNTYRGQGTPPAGVFFVGDAVCTTNPSAGRGITLGLWQVETLLGLLDELDHRDASAALDAWCDAEVRPWYEDHVESDAGILRRQDGLDVDPDGPITSAEVCAALDVDPALAAIVLPYRGMMAPPASLSAAEPAVRALLRSGWRPACDAGPSRAQLVDSMRLVSA